MSNISINGSTPNLENHFLQELITLEHWSNGIKQEDANVVYLKISNSWLRIYFDYEILFFRESKKPSVDTCDKTLLLKNWGKKLHIKDKKIISFEIRTIAEGVEFKLSFSNKKTFIVQSVNDLTTVVISDEIN